MTTKKNELCEFITERAQLYCLCSLRMNTFLHILSFIGSLGLFLYGMKIMSEGLEKLAGDQMRNILGAMTRNRFMGVLTGVGVTALIQSSSATTVMVVSLVNAGLMTLRQAIGVIMGANIGTTVTAWIISLIGFKVSISALSLPLLAIALPLFFAGKGKTKNWGEFIFGFAFLFMGLNLLSQAAESLDIGMHMAGWLSHLPCERFWTIPLFVLMGTVMTMLMQSSVLRVYGCHADALRHGYTRFRFRTSRGAHVG